MRWSCAQRYNVESRSGSDSGCLGYQRHKIRNLTPGKARVDFIGAPAVGILPDLASRVFQGHMHSSKNRVRIAEQVCYGLVRRRAGVRSRGMSVTFHGLAKKDHEA